jgi:predicted extracellular nuclease
LESAGFVNLLAVRAHTYVYGGRSGLLDHALVSAELAQRASAFTWPINADEPPVMGYRMRGLTRDWFRETPYRASDHDPVIVDLDLGPSRSGIH